MTSGTRRMRQNTPDYYKPLYHIAIEVTSSTHPEEILDSLVRATAEAMGVKGCSLMLLSPNGKQLIHATAYGLSDSYIGKGPIGVGPILAEVLKGSPIAVQDINTDTRIQYRSQAIAEGIVSILSVPLVIGSQIQGVLRVYTGEPREFTQDDIEFLTLVAGLGGIALRKARQHEHKEHQLEEQLQENTAQLEKIKEELSSVEEAKNKLLVFISMVAHDLKSPLAAIQTYFGVMLGGYTGELNEKHSNMIEKSSLRIDALLELISDLLDISRIETGQIVQEMKDVSMAELAAEPIEDARRLAEERGLNLMADIASDVPPIRGSVTRLRQVFTNLLGNAIKFTDDGGTVTVRVFHANGQVIGEVSDTGPGIPEDELPRVFEDFYRASNVTAPGTGLGLPIVKRILEAHGGQIQAESPCTKTGEGSRFTFKLPTKG